LIWRIRDRRVFSRLSSDGRRARAGALWCTYLLEPTASPPRVAFAIGRAVGPAVTRNLIRRRLRMLLAASELPPGSYLIGARPSAAGRSYPELAADVERLLDQVRRG
jgi:ribonuclease P protein component